MATKAEKIGMIQRFSPIVELTGKETTEELDMIIKSRNNVDPAPEDKPHEEKPKKTAKESITFKLRTHALKSRTFSKEIHGDNFNEIADEFHKTNSDKVTKRIHDDQEDDE